MIQDKLNAAQTWQPPAHWQRITTIDAHTGGEPLRVILSGLPPIPGDTILERRRYLREHLDYLRTALMWEPRGHADMYGAIVTEPVSAGADMGVIFLHNEGYSSMCGHGIIALVTVALETGMFPLTQTTLRIDAPAGLITAHAVVEHGRVVRVRFENVPSFVYALDQFVEVRGIGRVRYDVAFGGAFYAYVNAAEVGVNLRREGVRTLIDVGMRIKHAVMQSLPIKHPFEDDLSFLYGTIFVGESSDARNHSRNVCIFADGEVDRSPTGTGVSGRAALHFARGEVRLNQPITIESIVDSCFTVSAIQQTRYGGYDAIIPLVEGSASIIGRNEFWIDSHDPLQQGFMLR
jgi:trans-L-3-hydroxyproline dehydratase